MESIALDAGDVTEALDDFSPHDLQRGRDYFKAGRVRQICREGEELLLALVQGTARAPYRVSIAVDRDTSEVFAPTCSCPVGGLCKHGVAALMELRAQIARGASPLHRAAPVRGGAPTPPRLTRRDARTRKTVAKGAVDPRIDVWLQGLATAAILDREGPPRPATEERLLYTFILAHRGNASPALCVRVERAPVLADGSFGHRKIIDATKLDWTCDPVVSPGDRSLVTRLGVPAMGYFAITGEPGSRVLSEAVATGRAFFEPTAGAFVRLAEGPARPTELTFVSNVLGWQRPTLAVAETSLPLPVSPPYYVDVASGLVGPLQVANAAHSFGYVWLLGAPVSPADAEHLAEQLARAKFPVGPPSPRVRRVREVVATPRVVLRLESGKLEGVADAVGGQKQPAIEQPWARVFFDYRGERVDPGEPALPRVTDDEVVTVRRAHAEESQQLDALAKAGLLPVRRVFSGRSPPRGVALTFSRIPPFAFAQRAGALASKGVLIEKDEAYGFDPVLAEDLVVELDELPASVERLGLSVGVRIGTETISVLPLLLAALREDFTGNEGALIVMLPDGRAVEVPAARLAPLRALLVELSAERGSGDVSRVRALALDPAVLSRSPESLRALRAALTSPRRVAVPKSLRAKLRDYQREGFVWLLARRRAGLGAVLADDMGLGKTIQTLALLLAEERDGKPSLVVCPKSVLGNWQAEAQRFAPKLKIHVHHGSDRALRTSGVAGADVVLTTYAILARDEELFTTQPFSTVVLDEAQTIKTAASVFTRAACAVNATSRVALSGTPMENHLGELWSVMRFVLPELFGESRAFARAFRRPIEKDGSAPARRELVARLRPFLLRRRKDEVASELPAKTVVIEYVELESAQRDVYETVRAAMDQRVKEALADRGLARSQIIVLDALLKLRQAVCDPRLLRAKSARRAGSAKLAVLVGKLRELAAEGRRVLVFSQFVSMLELVEKELRREKIAYLMLTGQTDKRAELVARFQHGEAPVFLLSLKAGGTGLNLTAAEVVIHYDPWWNPAAEAQATDRAHRIGQDKPVFVYKLVGKGTIEEKILTLQEKKQALFSSILDDGASVAKKLSEDDVAFLFER